MLILKKENENSKRGCFGANLFCRLKNYINKKLLKVCMYLDQIISAIGKLNTVMLLFFLILIHLRLLLSIIFLIIEIIIYHINSKSFEYTCVSFTFYLCVTLSLDITLRKINRLLVMGDGFKFYIEKRQISFLTHWNLMTVLVFFILYFLLFAFQLLPKIGYSFVISIDFIIFSFVIDFIFLLSLILWIILNKFTFNFKQIYEKILELKYEISESVANTNDEAFTSSPNSIIDKLNNIETKYLQEFHISKSFDESVRYFTGIIFSLTYLASIHGIYHLVLTLRTETFTKLTLYYRSFITIFYIFLALGIMIQGAKVNSESKKALKYLKLLISEADISNRSPEFTEKVRENFN